MSALSFQHVSIRELRNLRCVDVEPSDGANVLCGDNGQGKTSFLEALYLVATSRSFRTPRVKELIGHDAAGCSVRATIVDDMGRREQLVALSRSARVIKVDGSKADNAASFAVRTPVVVFHPGELTLTMGPASGRRLLLDRVALFSGPRILVALSSYGRAARARQRLLAESAQEKALEAYELVMAETGADVTRQRRLAAERIAEAFEPVFQGLCSQRLRAALQYRPGGVDDAAKAAARLAQQRDRDRGRPSATFGPHHDELLVHLEEKPARGYASQGQHRLLTLSLKIAEMVCISTRCLRQPVLLLDDVSSELDAERTRAFFAYLGGTRAQVFVTTTRPEMLQGLESGGGVLKVFEVVDGNIRATGG